MKMCLLFFVVAALGMTGCAVNKEWVAMGGSRADGVVQLEIEYGPFETPKTVAGQGLAVAKSRCAAWGYTDAESFGGVSSRVCKDRDAVGCNTWVITARFQCTGNLQH